MRSWSLLSAIDNLSQIQCETIAAEKRDERNWMEKWGASLNEMAMLIICRGKAELREMSHLKSIGRVLHEAKETRK